MPKLTITTSIDLPDDEFERAAVVSKAQPLLGQIVGWLKEHEVTGAVTHSFDGRSAPRKQANGGGAEPSANAVVADKLRVTSSDAGHG